MSSFTFCGVHLHASNVIKHIRLDDVNFQKGVHIYSIIKLYVIVFIVLM